MGVAKYVGAQQWRSISPLGCDAVPSAALEFYVPVCHISSQTKAGFEIRAEVAEVAAAALTLRRV